MWVRLADTLINTNHVMKIKYFGAEESAAGVHVRITFADGTTEEMSERLAEPLLNALAYQVDKSEAEIENVPSEQA